MKRGDWEVEVATDERSEARRGSGKVNAGGLEGDVEGERVRYLSKCEIEPEWRRTKGQNIERISWRAWRAGEAQGRGSERTVMRALCIDQHLVVWHKDPL